MYFLISPWMVPLSEEWCSNYIGTKYQLLVKISNVYVQERKEQENLENHYIIKDLNSIELLLNLWPKVVILLKVMVLVENPSMEKNSKTKISAINTLKVECYLWLMLDQSKKILLFFFDFFDFWFIILNNL